MADPNSPPLPRKAGTEIGKSGTLMYQGIITREEYNAALTRQALLQKIEIMRRSSSTIRSMLLVIKLPILSADWKMEAAQDGEGVVSPLDQEISDFVEQELFKRNIVFSDFLREGSTSLEFGYCVFEKVHDMTAFNGKTRIGLNKLAYRKQRTVFAWETKDGKPGIHQMIGDGDEFDIPREKLVIFTNDKEGDNYEGISVLRYAYKDWDMLDKLTIVNAIALEKLSIGIPVLSAREGQIPSPADIEKGQEILRAMRANEESYAEMPSTLQIEMMDMKANSTKEIIPTLNYHDSRISKGVLAGFMEIGGQSGSGAQALAKDLTSLFMKSEIATARAWQTTIMEDVIKPLIDLNYSDLPNGYPKLTFGTISDEDLDATATSLAALAEKKLITPDIDLESHLRQKFTLPAMNDEARTNYEETQKATLEQLKNPPAPVVPGAPGVNPDTKDNKDLKKPGDKTANPDDLKASIEAARDTRKRLIDVLIN